MVKRLHLCLMLSALLSTAACASENPVEVPVIADSSIFKTVAHIDPSDVPYAERIYVDYANDVAVYMYKDWSPPASKGDTVTTANGFVGSLVELTPTGFIADFGDAQVYGGMSGMPVFFNEDTIGYVSSTYENNYVYCIWN